MSWQLPHAPLLGRVLMAQAAGAVVAIAAALSIGPMIEASSEFPLEAALIFVAIAAMSIGFIAGYHPFPAFGSANQVTTIRAALLSVVAALVTEPRTVAVAWAAALISIAITALDGVDGWLARRSGMSSDFGARYDMEIDALLILVLAVLAWEHGRAGAWIVLAGAMRYLFVVAGYLWRWMNAPLPPSTRRKAVCVVQIVGLGVVVSPLLTAPVAVAIAAITLAALTWSFGIDVLWLRRHSA